MVWFIPLIAMALQSGLSAKSAHDQKKAAKGAQAAANAVEAEKLRLSRDAAARSEEQYNRYQRTYVPIEDELIREAQRRANPDVAAGLASADAELAAQTQRGVLNRQIGRRGINPADGAVADAEMRLALASGKNRAAAMTAARRAAVQDRTAKLAAVAAMGRNLPGMAYNYSAQSNAGLSDVYDNRMGQLNYQNGLVASSGNELGIALADALQAAPEMIGGFNDWRRSRPISPVRTTVRRAA